MWFSLDLQGGVSTQASKSMPFQIEILSNKNKNKYRCIRVDHIVDMN